MKTLIQIAPNMFNWVENPTKCVHLGDMIGVTPCVTCKGRVELKVFRCDRFGKCTLVKAVDSIACCNGVRHPDGRVEPCPGYEIVKKPVATVFIGGDPAKERTAVKPLSWAYGVTTVPERVETLLPRTLASLAAAGFDKPRLFVDGCRDTSVYSKFDLEVTSHYPALKTFGNWTLALWELYVRTPDAERYAVFQDDMVTVKGLREYLDAWYPKEGYLNLFQYGTVNLGAKGWSEATPLPGHQPSPLYKGKIIQGGKGAVALVFSRDAVVALLTATHTVVRPQDMREIPGRRLTLGQQKVDGSIVEAMNQQGWREWVHTPSLVQHTGEVSSMGNSRHPSAPDFPGEDFTALTLSH